MRNKKNIFYIFTYLFWVFIITFSFNKYAYEINETNAKIRVLTTSGNLSAREFDDNGFAFSHSPRIGQFKSPFYIVHYGLIYSDSLKKFLPDEKKNLSHWRTDPSLKYWNIPPKSDEQNYEKYFYNMASWLVDNQEEYMNGYHYLYNFDWPYKGYPTGQLSSPWWSGLTDGYAINLLLRAYDYFGEEKFLHTATNAYNSIIKNISDGGSVNHINNDIWIEEYVDPRFDGQDMSFVLNGMIYATYGIMAYEDYIGKAEYSSLLASSIINNITRFDTGGWSNYDLIGNPANIKYHKIHYILVEDLINRGFSINIELLNSWKKGFKNPGLYYVLKGPVSVAYYHFIASYILLILLPIIMVILTRMINCRKK